MKAIDYRDMRLADLKKAGRYSYLKLLLFWPVFGILFSLAERVWTNRTYVFIHCMLDDLIPFNEWFLFAYLFWFVYMVGMLAYGLLYDPDTFRRYMRFIILTFSVSMLVYFVYPSAQDLRPQQFLRENLLTRFMAGFYRFDTNTNVMPSLHVVGSMAVLFAAWNSKLFGKIRWRILFLILTVLICLSTVFLKQHSVIDVAAALFLSFVFYPVAFRR